MKSHKSRVVWVRTKAPSPEGLLNSTGILRKMVEAGLQELTGSANPAAAWSRFVRPTDIVGIKVNCLGGPEMCTRPALAQATVDSLQALPLPPNRALVWDRSSRELNRCGFSLNKNRKEAYLCFGTDEGGLGYEKELTVNGSVGSLYSTLLTRHCTAMINMPVLKDHGLCGLTASLKNIFGFLPRKDQAFYHQNINEVILDLNNMFRSSLCLIDGRMGLEGVISGNPKELGCIILGRNPVSVDSVMTRVMGFDPEKIRHIVETAELGLGSNTPKVVGDNVEDCMVDFKKPKGLKSNAICR